ncbi:MAG TPA: thioesterase family protein [Vicinamibacteria bacterium]|nr:thioesterase family protein [Vicinamibacteria bacterium]
MSDDEKELFDAVRALFVEKIPFNKLLGTEIEEVSFESASVRLGFRDELVGNYIRRSLHGGVVSATLDLTGGLVAFMGALRNADGRTPEEKMAWLANVGTIDLRVDYLRPGLGAHFLCSGHVLRTGNKVAVIRMELVNDEESLIAVGTGAYLVG